MPLRTALLMRWSRTLNSLVVTVSPFSSTAWAQHRWKSSTSCYRRVHQILSGHGVAIAKNYVGEYATSLEMAGASISLLKLNDAQAGAD